MSTTSTAQQVRVPLGGRSYHIAIGHALLHDESMWEGLPSGGDAMVVTNAHVGSLYLQPLQRGLARRHRRVLSVELPDGEQHKDWPTLNRVFDALLHSGCDRQTTLYALGGGVVGMAGAPEGGEQGTGGARVASQR